MLRPRVEFARAEDIAVGLAGAAMLLPIELLLLARTSGAGFPSAAWAVTGLFAGLALLVGLGIALGSALTERFAYRLGRPAIEPFARAAPALIVFFPALGSLFDGAWASTLPGARFGFLWAPILAFLLLALVLRSATAIARRPVGRAGLAIALPGLAIELDLFNRGLLASEYPDLHTLLLVVSTVMGGLGLRALIDAFAPFEWRWPRGVISPRHLGVMAASAGVCAIALGAGLGDKASRRAIADDGMHGRLLDRAAKAVFDFDGDSHAIVLGGGDCAMFNANIHPGAFDKPGNGVDEDCTGGDEANSGAQAAQEARRSRIQAWRRDTAVSAIAERLSRLNVVLIAVDALRADPFAATQENAIAYPHLFALRRRASWFTRAFSPSAGTDLSMAGAMTGRVNPMFGSDLTLAEGLSAAGYQTHAVVPMEVLRSASRTLLSRGFASLDVVETDDEKKGPSTTSADRTTAMTLGFIDSWRKSPQRPFAVWAHYFDVHEHDELPATTPAIVASNRGTPPQSRIEKYRALVSVVDSAIGQLQAGLESRGLGQNTALVFFSDHGESLREERRLPDNHGRFVYNALVHVPLAVVLPGIEPGEITTPVSLLDLAPTFFDLIGSTAAAGEMEGESLLPLLLGAPPSLLEPPRALPLNETDQHGVIAWPHKLMVRPEANLHELYDLSRDFDEQTDLAEAEPELVRWLLQAYHQFPPLRLDRTQEARRRWEVKAEATRPSADELARLGKQLRAKTNLATRGWQPGGRPAALDPFHGNQADGDLAKVARFRAAHRKRERGEIDAPPDEPAYHTGGIVIEPLGPRRPPRTRRQAMLSRTRAAMSRVESGGLGVPAGTTAGGTGRNSGEIAAQKRAAKKAERAERAERRAAKKATMARRKSLARASGKAGGKAVAKVAATAKPTVTISAAAPIAGKTTPPATGKQPPPPAKAVATATAPAPAQAKGPTPLPKISRPTGKTPAGLIKRPPPAAVKNQVAPGAQPGQRQAGPFKSNK